MTSNGSPSSSNRRNYRGYLAERRSRAHAQAHAEAEATAPPTIPDHPLICADEPQWIDTADALASLIDHLRAAGRFGYDTEFIGETYYPPRLCLIQVATAERIALVDPLARQLDLAPFWSLLADPRVCPIVHAGQPDIEPIVRLTGIAPSNLFDTQLAAGAAALAYPASLASVVETVLDVPLAKGLTFTQWDLRPMSPQHQRYAADDVRYLPAVAAKLEHKLHELGRRHWADELFAEMAEPTQYLFDAEAQARRVLRQGSLPPRAFVTLMQLVALRERIAVGRCLPPRSVVKNGVLIELARHRPRSTQGLRELGIGKRQAESLGQPLIEAIQAGEAIPREQLPTRHRPLSPAQRERVDKMWKQLNRFCADQDVSMQLLVSRKQFTRFAREKLRGRSTDNHPLSQGWRATLVAPLLDEWFGD